ncbi:hypothetical protein H6F67_13690 [Microcoleus sp. FACHB-1515]|uniref:hypothetical protein n=1 Tax=Cyanophyceae TaxID=3028117 RepID=UPI001685A989|nr:hypothetical protein [Microcoleus sp. FACHB-1515]MBD2090904.1 hypothetical protein [Microcoleus sp. FACHB-1515]
MLNRLKIAGIAVAIACASLMPTSATAQTAVQTSVREAVTFSCRDSEAAIRRKGGAVVAVGQTRFYIGYQQVNANNQNPILIRFDNGRRTWCQTTYETSNDDSRGYGLVWNGQGVLYAVFSSTGTQGTPSQDFRRFATRGWLTSYGNGGGAKAAVLARINPATGNVTAATFLSSVLTSGRTNSIQVTALNLRGDREALPERYRLVVEADSWFAPRRIDRQPMQCTGSSPFRYRLEFSGNLQSVIRASADRCS